MEDMDEIGQKVTILLEAAAEGRPGAAEAFFEMLLESRVFVGVDPAKAKATPADPMIIGEVKNEEHGLITVTYDAKECVPIFSEKAFLEKWAGVDLPVQEIEMKKLLWMIGEETWLYLNSNQEVGREITPWEIARLKQGVDAIPEIVAAENDNPLEDIEVRSDSELYPELKRELLPVLEIYPELQEAFIVAVKEGGSEMEKPLVGVKYAKIPKAKRLYLNGEIEALLKDFMPEEHMAASVVIDDLGDPSSPNHSLFEDATPFYIATKPFPEASSAKRLITSSIDSMKNVFSLRGKSDEDGGGPEEE